MYTVKAIAVLDNDGERVVAKVLNLCCMIIKEYIVPFLKILILL